MPCNNKGLFFAHTMCPLWAGWGFCSTFVLGSILRSMVTCHGRGKEPQNVSDWQLYAPVQKHMSISTELIGQNERGARKCKPTMYLKYIWPTEIMMITYNYYSAVLPHRKNYGVISRVVFKTENHDPHEQIVKSIQMSSVFNIMEFKGNCQNITHVERVDIYHETIFGTHLSNKYRCVTM